MNIDQYQIYPTATDYNDPYLAEMYEVVINGCTVRLEIYTDGDRTLEFYTPKSPSLERAVVCTDKMSIDQVKQKYIDLVKKATERAA